MERDSILKASVNPAWKFLLPLFGLWLLIYGSYALVRPPLPDGSGTIHAEIAREMVARHDWSAAYVNGVESRTFSHNPAARILDWSIAAGYRVFGIADWSARLPIALCVLAVAAIAFFFGRKLFVWNAAGLYAALIVLTWPGTFLATRDLTPVPFVVLGIDLIAVALWSVIGTRRRPAEWPLLGWAAGAFFLGIFLEGRHHTPLAWLGPVLPLALLAGGWLAHREAFSKPAPGRRIAYAIFAVGVAGSLGSILLTRHRPFEFTIARVSVALTTPAASIPLFILTAALIAGVTGNLIFRLRNRPRIANCFLAGMLAGMTVSIEAGMVVASPFFSSQILAEAIRPELQSGDIVAVDGSYPEASSFAFYLERPISLTPHQNEAMPAQMTAGAGTPDQIWSGPSRVYLWTRVDRPYPVPGQSYVIAASGGKEILSNQPNSGGASF